MGETTLGGLLLRDDDIEDIEDTVIRAPRQRVRDDRRDDALGDTVIGRPPRSAAGDAAGALDDTVIRRPPLVEAPPLVQAGTAETASTAEPDGTAAPDDTVVRVPGRPGADRHLLAGAGAGLPAFPASPTAPSAHVPSVRIGDQTFRLDRPVVIGRRPSLPRVSHGPAPELVTVRSVYGQVSSSHVRLHAEGEAVVVEDLRSTNGTVVRPAGAPPYRMPSGASVVALTGTVVEIGDGNAIEVLSPYLRVAPSAPGPSAVPARPTDPPAHGTPRPTRERS